MKLPKRQADYLTQGERAIADLLIREPRRLTGKDIARALDSTPDSIKVMVCNMRRKGVTITGGGSGQSSVGYRLDGLA